MQQEKKKSFLLLMLLFLFQQTIVNACDLCGAFIGVMPYDNQSSFSIAHRYRIFSGYQDMAGGTIFPQGAYRLSSPMSVQHNMNQMSSRSPNDFESYKVIELRGKWFVSPRFELNFILPFAENKSNYDNVKERTDGIGDATLLAGYHLIHKTGDGNFRHRLVIGIGIKLPTGNYNAKNSNGERIPMMLQTGTGSTDKIIYCAYTGGGKNFRWGATASVKFSGTNKYEEHLSPGTSNTAFFAYVIDAGNWKILPEISFYQEYLNGMYTGVEYMQGTNMNAMLLGPSLDAFRKNLGVNLSFQLPVYEKTESYNPQSKARISAGITWSFNQEKFLIHTTKKP